MTVNIGNQIIYDIKRIFKIFDGNYTHEQRSPLRPAIGSKSLHVT
jgi:hypothetical protein